MKIVLVVFFIFLTACHTHFSPYEPADNRFEGKGGTKVIVEGIEWWDYGEPHRTFTILGIINDSRPGGIIPMAQFEGDIARKVKEVGGDAVILLSEDSQITGYIGNASATTNIYGGTAYSYGNSSTFAARRHSARLAVIKYLDGAEATP